MAKNSYGETIEVKRNAKGKIVVVHSDYGTVELIPIARGLHQWGLYDPVRKSRVIISAEEEKIIDEGYVAIGGATS